MKSWKNRINDALISYQPIQDHGSRLFASKDSNFFIYKMKSADVHLNFLFQTGFRNPILVEDGYIQLTYDPEKYSPDQFADVLGRDKKILVIDVDRQQNEQWTFDEWCRYFTLPDSERKKIYNVISVEFSMSNLESWLTVPEDIRKLDWIQYWPKHLIKYNPESLIGSSNFPKVQHYCLMGVKGSYTDFHIDFGGTSVWYHIIHGKKIFFLIPPTENNLKKYEQWNNSPKQSSIFFADLIDPSECIKTVIQAGNSLLIPSGWIHAVYTPEDSVVFGGNFLHSLHSKLQIKITEIEEKCKISKEFMFPYFQEMNWLVFDHYAKRFMKEEKEEEISVWERESLIHIMDYVSKNKKYFPLYLIESHGEWWAPYIIDVISSYLQSKDIPNKMDYLELNVYSPSPNPKLQSCFCVQEGEKTEKDDQTYVGCDYCGGWFHSKCIHVTEDQIETLKSFYCQKCKEKAEKSRMKRKGEGSPYDIVNESKKMKKEEEEIKNEL